MNNANLYNQYNQLQVRDAKEILHKFDKISPRSSDACSLIDIGSGCGKVLSSVVIKMLKMELKKVIGLDISSEMVDFAKKNYENKFLKFYCLDIVGDASTTETIISSIGMQLETCDIVTSFYCLNWVHDLRGAFLKIKNLLKPSGHFVCSLLKTHIIFDAYLQVATDDKYSSYMHDVQAIIPPTFHIVDPVKTLKEIFTDLGYEIKLLEHKIDVFDYETKLNYKNAMKAVNPFVSRMPENLQEEFMEDLAEFSKNSCKQNLSDNCFNAPYEIIYIVVSKTP